MDATTREYLLILENIRVLLAGLGDVLLGLLILVALIFLFLSGRICLTAVTKRLFKGGAVDKQTHR